MLLLACNARTLYPEQHTVLPLYYCMLLLASNPCTLHPEQHTVLPLYYCMLLLASNPCTLHPEPHTVLPLYYCMLLLASNPCTLHPEPHTVLPLYYCILNSTQCSPSCKPGIDAVPAGWAHSLDPGLSADHCFLAPAVPAHLGGHQQPQHRDARGGQLRRTLLHRGGCHSTVWWMPRAPMHALPSSCLARCSLTWRARMRACGAASPSRCAHLRVRPP